MKKQLIMFGSPYNLLNYRKKKLANIKQTWVDNNVQYENDVIACEPYVNIENMTVRVQIIIDQAKCGNTPDQQTKETNIRLNYNGRIVGGRIRISNKEVDLTKWSENNDCDFGISIVVDENKDGEGNNTNMVSKRRNIHIFEYVKKESRINKDCLDGIIAFILDLKVQNLNFNHRIQKGIMNKHISRFSRGELRKLLKIRTIFQTGVILGE